MIYVAKLWLAVDAAVPVLSGCKDPSLVGWSVDWVVCWIVKLKNNVIPGTDF